MKSIYTNRYGTSGNHPSFGWTSAAASYNPPMKEPDRFHAAMNHAAYPLTAAYDPVWVFEMSMGPINLWLLEGLLPHMALIPGMKVLDLGCGAASTSIFLAREAGVEVWAADLWIDPEDNRARIAEAGLGGQIHALRALAQDLPFERDFFDAVISIDAYHYFGTDVRYLTFLRNFLKPGGAIGVAVPCNGRDPDVADAILPEPKLAAELGADWYTFRSHDWWRRQWSRTPGVAVILADDVPHGRSDFGRWIEATEAHYGPTEHSILNGTLLSDPAGRQIGLCRLVAHCQNSPPD